MDLSERYQSLVIELDNTVHLHQNLYMTQHQISDELRVGIDGGKKYCMGIWSCCSIFNYTVSRGILQMQQRVQCSEWHYTSHVQLKKKSGSKFKK